MMSVLEQTLFNDLLNEFKTCTQLQYSGKLDIKSSRGHKWTFYYRLGRIVWASGGTHPGRRFRRFIAQHCPKIEPEQIQLQRKDAGSDPWDYRLLEVLHENNQIKLEQIKVIVENAIAEVLFDLAQQANFSNISCNRSVDVILDTAMSFTSADLSLKHMQSEWHTWTEAGLASFSPNLALILRQPQQLEQLVSPNAYKNFLKLATGKYTLRDLAVKMKQDLLSVCRFLRPYILRGIIELVEAPDLPLIAEKEQKPDLPQPKKQTAPLIACIDDSAQVCSTVKNIVTSNGMRCVSVQDPLAILTTLLEQKPDFIFLDLIMPVASGYEICTQLRRVSAFANTPIVILTSNDGIIDRVRAKVAGSTDFISKPVDSEKVMAIIDKYLNTGVAEQNHFTSPELSFAY